MDTYKKLCISKEMIDNLKPNPLYDGLEKVEQLLNKAIPIPIFFNCCIVRKIDLYNNFKFIYNQLPSELIDNRDYLNKHKEDNVFTQLNKMNYILLEQSKSFCGFILVNKTTIFDIIDKICVFLPENIEFCCKNNNQ